MTLKATYTPGSSLVDFFARNAADQWWNGSAFENYSPANLASYRIAATETPAGSGIYQGAEPSSATVFELRYRGATLSDSVILSGPSETDSGETLLRNNAQTAASLGSTNNAVLASYASPIATAASQATAAASDAKKSRQFNMNKRTRQVLGPNQYRYTVYEDDGTTVAYRVDFDPATGNLTAV